MPGIDDLRNRFANSAVREEADAVAEEEAVKRAKKGVCPACGAVAFVGLVCRVCRFDASDMTPISAPEDELPHPDDVEKDIRTIAARALEFKANPPRPPDPEEERAAAELEAQVRADERDRRRARSSVEHKRTEDGARYAVEEDPVTGKLDAVFQFGKWRGHLVSDMATKPEGGGYLRWVLAERFPDDLKKIIRLHLGLPEGA